MLLPHLFKRSARPMLTRLLRGIDWTPRTRRSWAMPKALTRIRARAISRTKGPERTAGLSLTEGKHTTILLKTELELPKGNRRLAKMGTQWSFTLLNRHTKTKCKR